MGDAALAVEKTAQIVEGAERLFLKMGESEVNGCRGKFIL
jgi:hypothetical protein